MGHIGQSYQITQWYPKPAVYDRDGWHAMPYLGQGEFYSEYGTFDVYITLPKNYTIGATGDMPKGDVDNDAEVARLDELTKTQDIILRIKMNIMKSRRAQNSQHHLTLQRLYTTTKENVHDFAWFADKRYKVLKG